MCCYCCCGGGGVVVVVVGGGGGGGVGGGVGVVGGVVGGGGGGCVFVVDFLWCSCRVVIGSTPAERPRGVLKFHLAYILDATPLCYVLRLGVGLGGAQQHPSNHKERWRILWSGWFFFENMFASKIGFEWCNLTTLVREKKTTGFVDVKPFTMVELQNALRHPRRSKCADSNSIVAEWFVYGNLELHEHLFRLFNLILVDGCVEKTWKQTTLQWYRNLMTLPILGIRDRWRCWISDTIFCSYGLQTFEANIGSVLRNPKAKFGFVLPLV